MAIYDFAIHKTSNKYQYSHYKVAEGDVAGRKAGDGEEDQD